MNAKNDPEAYAKILQEFGTITSDDYQEITEKDFGKIEKPESVKQYEKKKKKEDKTKEIVKVPEYFG